MGPSLSFNRVPNGPRVGARTKMRGSLGTRLNDTIGPFQGHPSSHRLFLWP